MHSGRRFGVFFWVLATGGCASPAVVTSADRDAAEAWVRRERNPLPVKSLALWHASNLPDGMLCGEIEATGALRGRQQTIRYVFDRHLRKPFGQVENHALVVSTDAAAQAALDLHRASFDSLWADYCAPYAPIARKISAWTGFELGL